MIEVSFCQTCGNRRKYAERTVARNLFFASRWNAEFILLDYGSTDGLVDFFFSLPDRSKIRLFRYETDGPFHCAHAKNLSHCRGSGRVLCNLDIDNYLLPESYDELCGLRDGTVLHGADPVRIRRTMKSGPAKIMSNGSYGRISMTKNTFMNLRGYDEKMRRMGYQDTDLIRRAKARGFKIVRSKVRSPVIDNQKDDGWLQMAEHNSEIGRDPKRAVNQDGFGRGSVIEVR